MTAAIVFLHESIHAREPEDLTTSRVGGLILHASPSARRLILLAVLSALARAPLEASSWQVNVICEVRFVHDYRWGFLIKALLRTKLMPDDELLCSILERLSNLVDRLNSNYPMNSYEFPFATIVRFVNKHLPTCSSDRVRPAIAALFDRIKEALTHDLVALKGYSEQEAPALAATPDKWFTKKDRTAIELIVNHA